MSQKTLPVHKPVLRAATYLVPSIPVEYFEAVLHYLEVRLGCDSSLRYESRWEGPPADRKSPFDQDVDFGQFHNACDEYYNLKLNFNSFHDVLWLLAFAPRRRPS